MIHVYIFELCLIFRLHECNYSIYLPPYFQLLKYTVITIWNLDLFPPVLL